MDGQPPTRVDGQMDRRLDPLATEILSRFSGETLPDLAARLLGKFEAHNRSPV
jgi:hypothetical protein